MAKRNGTKENETERDLQPVDPILRDIPLSFPFSTGLRSREDEGNSLRARCPSDKQGYPPTFYPPSP